MEHFLIMDASFPKNEHDEETTIYNPS